MLLMTTMSVSLMSCGGGDDSDSVSNGVEKPEQPQSDPNQLTVDLQMPGTLSSNIPNQKFTKLKIKGDINGSDIKYIRGIISGLSELDLSNANIVEGGDVYYKISYITQKNVIGECMFADLIGSFKIILPKSATFIDNYAFENCIGLKEIVMSDNINSISAYGFSGCTNLTKVGLSNSLRSLGESAFEKCASIDNIVLPSNVSSIGRNCFYECEKLTSISLSEKLGTIGQRAFYGCKRLSKIEIPSNVYSIETYAFEGCSSLSDIIINGRIKVLKYGVFKGTKLKSFTTPESLEEIHSQAFLDCYELEKINVGKNVKKIETGCATYCTKFSEFIVSSDNVNYCSIDGVLFNKDKTQLISYPHGKPDSEYSVPSSVTSIGGRSFESTENLKSIILPSSLNRIEANAFLSCPTFNKKLVEFHAKSKTAPLVVYNGVGQYGLPHRENERFETAYVPKGCLKEYSNMWQKFFNHIEEE